METSSSGEGESFFFFANDNFFGCKSKHRSAPGGMVRSQGRATLSASPKVTRTNGRIGTNWRMWTPHCSAGASRCTRRKEEAKTFCIVPRHERSALALCQRSRREDFVNAHLRQQIEVVVANQRVQRRPAAFHFGAAACTGLAAKPNSSDTGEGRLRADYRLLPSSSAVSSSLRACSEASMTNTETVCSTRKKSMS